MGEAVTQQWSAFLAHTRLGIKAPYHEGRRKMKHEWVSKLPRCHQTNSSETRCVLASAGKPRSVQNSPVKNSHSCPNQHRASLGYRLQGWAPPWELYLPSFLRDPVFMERVTGDKRFCLLCWMKFPWYHHPLQRGQVTMIQRKPQLLYSVTLSRPTSLTFSFFTWGWQHCLLHTLVRNKHKH